MINHVSILDEIRYIEGNESNKETQSEPKSPSPREKALRVAGVAGSPTDYRGSRPLGCGSGERAHSVSPPAVAGYRGRLRREEERGSEF